MKRSGFAEDVAEADESGASCCTMAEQWGSLRWRLGRGEPCWRAAEARGSRMNMLAASFGNAAEPRISPRAFGDSLHARLWVSTRRLHLRVPEAKDREELTQLGMANEIAERIAPVRQAIERRRGLALVVIERSSGQPIGWIEARLAKPGSETAVISIWLSPAHRGAGLGIEAGRAAVPLIAAFLKPKILWADVEPGNGPAIRLLRRLGLKPSGVKASRGAAGPTEVGYCKDLMGVV